MHRSLPPIVKNLLMINVVMFFAAWMLPTVLLRWGIKLQVEDLLGMHYFASSKFNLIQLITYMFLHAPFPNFAHIFFNMFALFMFGPILENIWGGKKFLFYYLLTGIGAGLVQQLAWYSDLGGLFAAMDNAIALGSSDALLPYANEMSKIFVYGGNISALHSVDILAMKTELQNSLITVGASGSVFGLLLAFGWLFPEQRLYLMFIPVPIKARWFVAGYAVVELFLGVSNFSGDNIAHFAHIGGMLFGVILILYWKRKDVLYTRR